MLEILLFCKSKSVNFVKFTRDIGAAVRLLLLSDKICKLLDALSKALSGMEGMALSARFSSIKFPKSVSQAGHVESPTCSSLSILNVSPIWVIAATFQSKTFVLTIIR